MTVGVISFMASLLIDVRSFFNGSQRGHGESVNRCQMGHVGSYWCQRGHEESVHKCQTDAE